MNKPELHEEVSEFFSTKILYTSFCLFAVCPNMPLTAPGHGKHTVHLLCCRAADPPIRSSVDAALLSFCPHNSSCVCI